LAAANASGYSGHFILVNLVAAQHGYAAAVTADHGLLERFVNEDGSHNLSHTCSRVPFGLVLALEGSKRMRQSITALKRRGAMAAIFM
jgi:bisphosphoglycerate-independent phosphoglycerate mutase (AlkP superfamily)